MLSSSYVIAPQEITRVNPLSTFALSVLDFFRQCLHVWNALPLDQIDWVRGCKLSPLKTERKRRPID